MAKKKSSLAGLHTGEIVSGMPPPNHCVPLVSRDLASGRWPLLRIVSDDECPDELTGVFFDPRHGQGWWEWDDRAPTWMDPNVFVDLCKQCPELMALLEECFRRNSEQPAAREGEDLLDEVMENYLVYLLERFERVRPLLLQWLVRHHCYERTDPRARPPKKKRSRRKQKQVE